MTIVDSTKDIEKFESDEEYLNNIVTFCGDRGSGKTTAMKTFTRLLSNQKVENKFFESLKNTSFYALKSIDPSNFEATHHVLDFIISLMFKDFEMLYLNQLVDVSNEEKYTLLEQFQVVYRNLSALRNPQKYQDLEYDYEGDAQKLSDIASDINLRGNLFELIKGYLKLKKSDYLVLMIDDLDINARYAYEIAEEIRRYLNIPNVLIIMAIRIEQLNYCLLKELMFDFQPLIDTDKKFNMELTMMANKYLNKLIPESRRVQLPDLKVVSIDAEDLVEIQYSRKKDGQWVLVPELSSEMNSTIENTILKYIFEMTDIVLVQERQNVHPIIPSTLRELVMLYDYLGQMKKGCMKENILLFKRYFMDVWCKNNLNDYTYKIVIDWDSQQTKKKNNYICEQIELLVMAFVDGDEERLKDFRNSYNALYEDNIDDLFDPISYAQRQSEDYSFSLGEVLNLLMDVNKIVKNKEVETFISACYLMYSILLNELKFSKLYIREDGIMQPNEVNSLIAGSLWGDKLDDILPWVLEGNEQESFSRCRFSYDLTKLLGNFVGNEKLFTKYDNANNIYMNNEIYEKLVNSAIDKLFILGATSNFGMKNRLCNWRETFISNNNSIKTNVEFNLDSLFHLGMDIPFVCEKINFDETLVSYNEDKVNMLLAEYGINKEAGDYIAYNLELSRYILNACIERKPFSRGDSVDKLKHYKNLFHQVNKSLTSVFDLYGGKNKTFILNVNSRNIYEIISWFYSSATNTDYYDNIIYSSSMKNIPIENKKLKDIDNELINIPKLNKYKASKKSSCTSLLKRCDILLRHIENKPLSSIDKKKSKKKIDELVVSLKNISKGDKVPTKLINIYNQVWQKVKAYKD